MALRCFNFQAIALGLRVNLPLTALSATYSASAWKIGQFPELCFPEIFAGTMEFVVFPSAEKLTLIARTALPVVKSALSTPFR